MGEVGGGVGAFSTQLFVTDCCLSDWLSEWLTRLTYNFIACLGDAARIASLPGGPRFDHFPSRLKNKE